MDKKRKKCKEIIIEFIDNNPEKWFHPYELVGYGMSVFNSLFLQATYHREASYMAEDGLLHKTRDENGYIIFKKKQIQGLGEFEEIDEL